MLYNLEHKYVLGILSDKEIPFILIIEKKLLISTKKDISKYIYPIFIYRECIQ